MGQTGRSRAGAENCSRTMWMVVPMGVMPKVQAVRANAHFVPIRA